jgi:hypothetical protein
MHIEFLLEEPSAEAAMKHLVPRILGPQVEPGFIHHQGKQDLLHKLPDRLRAYAQWVPRDWRIVVLVDEDRQDCREIKSRLQQAASHAGLHTVSSPGPGGCIQVVNRIAIEELEAWFFGDIQAIVAAYPDVPLSLGTRAKYRNPDAISGGTWESLERVLKKAGYYSAGMPKIEVADRIGKHMDPQRNTSKSFQVFRDALRRLTA